MAGNIPFPLPFKRQFAGPLDQDAVFQTTAAMNAYLTSPLRYAGMVVTCVEEPDKVFILNPTRDAWTTVGDGGFSSVVSFDEFSELPEEGNADVIYITLDNNKGYFWGGAEYIPLGISLKTNNTFPNELRSVVYIDTSSNTEENFDYVIQPKGTGSILAQVPDHTSFGGSKRGENAVDFQTNRLSPAEVASGNFSAILGGKNNKASGIYSGVVSGSGNTASGEGSSVGGGGSNTASEACSTIGGGSGNTASGPSSFLFLSD